MRTLPQEVRVRPQPVHPDPRAPEPAGELRAARLEGVRPPPRQEPQPVRAEHSAQHLSGDVVGQHPEVLRRRPRRVREVADPDIRPQLAEHPRHQRQVVVLHQHRCPRRRLLGQRLGEGTVVGLVRRPLTPELRVEDRFQRGLVKHVVDKPEDRVRDAVVGVGEDGRVDVEHPHLLAAGRLDGQPSSTVRAAHRLPIGVAQRGAHPHRPRVRPDRRQPGDQPAAAPPGMQRPVLPNLVRNRAAIGRDQHLSAVRGSHTPQPSPARKRSNVRFRSVGGSCTPCIRPDSGVYATFRVAYSAISTIGGRSSVSTEYVRGSNPSSPRSNWVREGRIRWPRASRSWAVR